MSEQRETFTPGPWRRAGSTRNPTGRIWAPDGKGNVEVAQVGNYADKELLRFNKDRWDADAHLIAAAPELYEALHDVVTSIAALELQGMAVGSIALREEIDRARLALLKAEGRT